MHVQRRCWPYKQHVAAAVVHLHAAYDHAMHLRIQQQEHAVQISPCGAAPSLALVHSRCCAVLCHVGMDRVVVAVIDSGVEVASSAVGAALWTNAAEVAGDGIDNDGNGARFLACQTACLSAAQAYMHHGMIWGVWTGNGTASK